MQPQIVRRAFRRTTVREQILRSHLNGISWIRVTLRKPILTNLAKTRPLRRGDALPGGSV